jgi:intracellular sulfur oxidation DsrE/DsrF family protein
MSQAPRISEEQINAFVDSQLDAEETERVLVHIDGDAEANAQVCEVRRLQDMVRHAYGMPAHRSSPSPRRARAASVRRRAQAIAACLLLAMGAALGWMAHTPHPGTESTPGILSLADANATAGLEQGNGVIVHLSSSDPARMKAALRETERLLAQNARLGHNVPVEVLVNGPGLDLLRVDTTTGLGKIRELRSRYANVSFLACRKTLERFKLEHGVDAKLLSEVEVASSALDQILTRLREGWNYVQI